jgi:4-amino-4-deoxy-L-arabinose transferase-like glycosyltransferase
VERRGANQQRHAPFALIVLGIAVVGLIVRVAYVVFVKRYDALIADEKYYYYQSRWLAEGYGFVVAPGSHVPSALHPPLPSILLAPSAWIGWGDAVLSERLFLAFVGAVTVFVVGYLGREVAGERVGYLAAGLAAIIPGLWMNDGIIMSEPFSVLCVALLLLLTFRYLKRPNLWTMFGMGVLAGLGVLTRGELLLLVPFVIIPAIIAKRADGWQTGIVRLGAAGIGALLFVAPWVGYNLSRFQEPLFVSGNLGGVICGANNPTAYYGPQTGMWILNGCPLPKSAPDQSVLDHYYQDRGVDYMRDHAGRLPVVMVKRVARTWEVYAPTQMVDFLETEGRPRWVSWTALAVLVVMLPFVIGGIVVLRRRRLPCWPLVSVLGYVTFAGMIFGGNPRYRVPGEVALVVLSAVAVDALLARSSRAAPEPADSAVVGAEPVDGDRQALVE